MNSNSETTEKVGPEAGLLNHTQQAGVLPEPAWLARVRFARRIGYVLVLVLVSIHVARYFGLEPANPNPTFPQAELLQDTVEELVRIAHELPDDKLQQIRPNWGRGWAYTAWRITLLDTWDPNRLHDPNDPNSVQPHALAIEFVRRPSTERQLDLASSVIEKLLSEYEYRLTYRHPLRPLIFTDHDGAALSRLTIALCTAARVAFEEDQQPDLAIWYLRHALSLGQITDQLELRRIWNGNVYNELIVIEELSQVLRDGRVSERQASAIAELLGQYLDLEDMVADYAGLSEDINSLFDVHYSSDSEGGYLVVHRANWLILDAWERDPINSQDYAQKTQPRSRIWNIGAPLFHRRQSVAKQFDALREDLNHAVTIVGMEDWHEYSALPYSLWETSQLPPSGIFSTIAPMVNRQTIELEKARTMHRRAVYVMAHLAAHRATVGSYPEDLSQIENFVEPLDLNTHLPFLYEKTEFSYELRSEKTVYSPFERELNISTEPGKSYLRDRGKPDLQH